MAVKYIKDKFGEVVYPITKAECVVDMHPVTDSQIDLIFEI